MAAHLFSSGDSYGDFGREKKSGETGRAEGEKEGGREKEKERETKLGKTIQTIHWPKEKKMSMEGNKNDSELGGI